LLLAVLSFLSSGGAKELKYPDGVRPGDQISGTDGEFFRYKHVLIKPPDDDDRMESLRMAEDIKCTACVAIVRNLLKKAESNSEDHIMDQLDGELVEVPELTDNPQENRVNANRKGCNKHFKDELLLRGWSVSRCPEAEGAKLTVQAVNEEGAAGTKGSEVAPLAREGQEFCLEQRSRLPTERDVDTYSTRNEAAFYACENTVARYAQEIASLIAQRLEDGGDREEAIHAACEEAARCRGMPRGSKKKGKKAAKTGNKKQKQRKPADDL